MSAVQLSLQAIDAMNRASHSAREILRREGAGQSAHVKAGAIIVFLGRSGETDEHKLCEAAIREALGRLPRDAEPGFLQCAPDDYGEDLSFEI